MPTSSQASFKLLETMDPVILVRRVHGVTLNTSFTDRMDHPFLGVPCPARGGLSVGLRLVGRYTEESLLFTVGSAAEGR